MVGVAIKVSRERKGPCWSLHMFLMTELVGFPDVEVSDLNLTDVRLPVVSFILLANMCNTSNKICILSEYKSC